MAQNILIATLGDHPAVVTGMVKALREKKQIEIDVLHVLHPENTGKYIGREGLQLIAKHLKGTCDVKSEPLPFSDPRTKQESEIFLETLAGVLMRYQNQADYHVYLSLAGGRKNMSALMALAPQFFPVVRGLYHLLDRRERSRKPTFPSIEEMELNMSPEEVKKALNPPNKDMILVPIPHPKGLADANEFWKTWSSSRVLDYDSQFKDFIEQIRSPEEGETKLQIWLSEQAMKEYQNFGPKMKNKLRGYARRMQSPSHLEARTSGYRGWETDCEVYPEHGARSALRLFYYWDQTKDELTICRAMNHEQYDRKGELWHEDYPKAKPLSALENERVLLVPLGKSPMIATQTYTLLQEEEGNPYIPVVAVLYPGKNRVIGNGVRLLQRVFEEKNNSKGKNKKVEFDKIPIPSLKDIASKTDCETYLDALLGAIEDLQTKYPDRPIALSLSGGRKGMSALALFAAQESGITEIYHTLITDIELEAQIEKETNLNVLKKLSSQERAKRLFLEEYDRSKFQLFTIPVIALAQPQE